jgi:beta-phosphoglucomutase family hydrolase
MDTAPLPTPRDIGVIFDMDGVLVDSAAPHRESWKRLAAEIGGRITDEQFTRTFGRQNRDIIPILFGPVDEVRLCVLADRKETIYRDLVRTDPPIVPGVIELIRDLHGRGVRLAIGSSGPLANIRLVLEAMDVSELFTAIVSGDDVTRGKPDPQVFQLAAERLSLPPHRCVVIEDAPVGIQAAKAAGANAVAVALYHPPEVFDGADLTVSSIMELAADRVMSLVFSSSTTA